MDQAKILTARRAYEFAPDNLRLTVLVAAGLNQHIQQLFRFQVAQIATPLEMFGPVPITIPPGIVFDYGSTQTPDGLFTPIRFLHFEPHRIVIDVAGPSSAIDWTYEQLRGMWAELRAPDGSLAVGEPERTVDYSEINTRLDFGLEKLVSEPLRTLAQQTFAKDGKEQKVVPVSIRFQVANPSDHINPNEIGAGGLSRGQMIAVRADTRLEDGVYFSSTNLPTAQHLTWLDALNYHLSEF